MKTKNILSKLKLLLYSEPGIILAYILLALFFTFPLILNFDGSLAIRTTPIENPISEITKIDSDAFYQVWNLWFFKYSLIDLKINPTSHSDMVFYPNGFNNAATGYENLLNLLLSVPLQILFENAVLVYNILIIFNFVLAAYSTFLLANYFIKDRKIAFLAGIIFAFSPFMLARSLGHLNLFTTGAIPLFILFFLKLLKEPALKNSLYAALFFVLVAISSWHYALFSALFIIFSLIFFLFHSPKNILNQNLFKKILLFAILSSLFIIPIIFPFLRTYHPKETITPSLKEFIAFSADPLSYLMPPPLSNVGGQILNINDFKSFSNNDTESTTYLGLLEIAVLFFYFLNRKKIKSDGGLWLFLTISFFIFSLGPFLKIAGRVLYQLPLPYFFLKDALFFKFAREPARLSIFIMLFAAIIFAITLKYILGKKNLSQSHKNKILIIAGFLIIIERIIFPYPVEKIKIPSFYYEISKEKENYAILDLPDNLSNAGHRLYNFYQIIHKKRIISGTLIYTALKPDVYSWIWQNDFLRESICPDETPGNIRISSSDYKNDPKINEKLFAQFRTIDIKYIIIHKELIKRYEKYQNSPCIKLKENIDLLLGDEKPVFEDDLIKVYDINKMPKT